MKYIAKLAAPGTKRGVRYVYTFTKASGYRGTTSISRPGKTLLIDRDSRGPFATVTTKSGAQRDYGNLTRSTRARIARLQTRIVRSGQREMPRVVMNRRTPQEARLDWILNIRDGSGGVTRRPWH